VLVIRSFGTDRQALRNGSRACVGEGRRAEGRLANQQSGEAGRNPEERCAGRSAMCC
jgi:hypothetical protein